MSGIGFDDDSAEFHMALDKIFARTPDFDPERVVRLSRNNAMEPPGQYVRADDYDRLLALYRELKAREAFHGF